MESNPREVAVLFADVSGSTHLYETLGDAEALHTVGRCLEIIRGSSEEHAGRVVRTIGDGSLVVFPYAANAAYAAIDMQTRVARERTSRGAPLAIRIGMHFGPVVGVDDDVFGDAVNLASRLSDLAKGGETLVSVSTLSSLPPALRARVRNQNAYTVKGKSEDIGIVELVWQESETELTSLANRPTVTRAFLRLKHGSRLITLDSSTAVLAIGRESGNDLVIADHAASRRHARIERRRDKFVLVDQSSNGTYCTIAGDDEILLRREEMVLRGRGRLSFGHPYAEDPTEVLEFSCVD
ncbi:MAG: adenylate/guanylate cyclase domain-containing protein [Betaproteobacteria bacterium]|nr:adenylate/guanylate cyclase domain-containing protein [Betaproteobacteria bacterium]